MASDEETQPPAGLEETGSDNGTSAQLADSNRAVSEQPKPEEQDGSNLLLPQGGIGKRIALKEEKEATIRLAGSSNTTKDSIVPKTSEPVPTDGNSVDGEAAVQQQTEEEPVSDEGTPPQLADSNGTDSEQPKPKEQDGSNLLLPQGGIGDLITLKRRERKVTIRSAGTSNTTKDSKIKAVPKTSERVAADGNSVDGEAAVQQQEPTDGKPVERKKDKELNSKKIEVLKFCRVSDSGVHTTAKLSPEPFLAFIEDEDWIKSTEIKMSCEVDIALYATKSPPYKWIQFRLTDAAKIKSMCQSLEEGKGNDTRSAKGFFNDCFTIFIYPSRSGEKTDPNSSELPEGWSRPYMTPHTPNSETTYLSTTGWDFNVNVGVSGSEKASAGGARNFSATYKRNNQVQTTVKDFSIRDLSDDSMTGWSLYYTAMDGKKWVDHCTLFGDVSDIADSARSSLTFNGEAIYRAPIDCNDEIEWTVLLKPRFRLLRSSNLGVQRKCYSLHIEQKLQFDLDMKQVKDPADTNMFYYDI